MPGYFTTAVLEQLGMFAVCTLTAETLSGALLSPHNHSVSYHHAGPPTGHVIGRWMYAAASSNGRHMMEFLQW